MDEIGFRNWLATTGKSRKMQSDAVSRLKAIQRELGNCDLDSEYKNDCCHKLLSALDHKGINESMESFGSVNLPIGKYSLSSYKYALRMYITFIESTQI